MSKYESLFKDKEMPLHVKGGARAPPFMRYATHDGCKTGSDL